MKGILHLITQRDQPYGSQRKCCEHCGLASWVCTWTDDVVMYDGLAESEHADDYERCIDVDSNDSRRKNKETDK
jgi:hypothetical protein